MIAARHTFHLWSRLLLAGTVASCSGTIESPSSGTHDTSGPATGGNATTSGTGATGGSSTTGAGATTGGSTTTGGGSAGTGGAGSGGGSGGSGGSGGTGSTTDGSVPPNPPPDTCNGTLPGAFATRCSACHTPSGQVNSRYPDLYQFKGTLDDLKNRVRMGSAKGMPAFAPDLISDADLAIVHGYFTGGAMRPGIDVTALGSIVPLFANSDAKNPPIVTKRADGSIVTRGAGRVRGRHEKEGTFATYGPHYFEDRSYGFIVEDFTPTGKKEIRVTYLPIAKPDNTGNRVTNWRAWKVQGNNATFAENQMMADVASSPMPPTGPVAQVQQFNQKNIPQGHTMTIGQNLEFEFGIFFNPATLLTKGSRDSYYSDTFRYAIGVGGMTPNNLDYDQSPGPAPEARTGGDTTIAWMFAEPDMYMSQMALNTQHENVQYFLEGRRLFHTNFKTGVHSESGNPVFTEQMGKAGPLFNASSCETCHLKNGPGALLKAPLSETSSMVFKLYGSPDLGNQLQLQEGSATVSGSDVKAVMLGDGTVVNLSRPKFAVTATKGDASRYSARLARKLVGLGLLEAIDERTIIGRADRLDCTKDGISGRASLVKDPVSGVLRLGRFGWKAEKASIAHQVADAASADLGVGTSILPENGKAELSDDDLMRLTTYMRLIGVPPQRSHADAQVLKGEQLFHTVGCANCHVTDVVTGSNHPFSELRDQTIKPYTDLLLHDMGPDLADDSGVATGDAADAPAGAAEWRTPPLWGIGLHKDVNGNTGLLHDGRAANVLEAALWHGGEAIKAKERLMALPAADRDALLAFVMSL
jgi:CxxC motif-containing protein (DUF1111 family)